eukprot:11734256-Alexandrium_andersonii.AAC.1
MARARANSYVCAPAREPTLRPLTPERQPHDTHAAVHDGPMPMLHGYLFRTGNFDEHCAHAATS